MTPDEQAREEFIRRVVDAAGPLTAADRDEVWALLPKPVKRGEVAA